MLTARKVRNIREKIKNVGAPTFLGEGIPPVFAYVGERKELETRRVDVGEGKELEESGEWLVASGELRQEEDFTALRLRSGQAEDENAEEEGEEEKTERGDPSRKALWVNMAEGGSGLGRPAFAGRHRFGGFRGSGRFGGGLGGVGGTLARIFDGDEFGEDLGLDGPVAGFSSCAMLGLHKEVADISEGGSALGRDAVGGEGLEEFAEDVIDIDLGDEIAGGACEFFDEIVFAVKGAAVDGGVVEAEAVVFWMSGHGAEFAVGEFKVAEVIGIVRSFCHSW